MSKDIKTNQFTSTLKCGGEVFKTKGETILECLEQLRPKVIKSRSFLTINNKSKETEIAFNPPQLKRLVANSVYREILQKRLLLALK